MLSVSRIYLASVNISVIFVHAKNCVRPMNIPDILLRARFFDL